MRSSPQSPTLAYAMRRVAIILLVTYLFTVAIAHDTFHITPVQELAAPYHFNFVTWELAHLPSKWLHILNNYLLPYRRSDQQKLDELKEYFDLKGQLSNLGNQLSQAAATNDPALPGLEQQRTDLDRRIAALRPDAEETLESLISNELRKEGVPPTLGNAIFPPIDVSMTDLPTILIVSPRDRIERQESYLLKPNIPPSARTALEDKALQQDNLSALVDDLGGLSTYPTIIQSDNLNWALVVSSHEWLHNYLFLRPLGQHMQDDGDMFSLNETTANLFGNELGNRIYSRTTGKPEPPLPEPPGPSQPCPQDQFCFGNEMNETRVRTDELLAQGKVEEAEAYMEQRRQVFVDRGYYIRRINQAYFAFHGTYADSPSSVSPLYRQLLEVRRAEPSLAAFIHDLQGITSYRQFLDLHQRLTGHD